MVAAACIVSPGWAARQLRGNAGSQVQGEVARDQRSLVNTFPFNSGGHGQHREHGNQRQLYADLEPREARQRNRNQNRSPLFLFTLRSCF